MGERYRRNPNTQCKICDEPVYRRPFELQRNGGKAFCSQACYGIFCRKENACVICGKMILARYNKKTCSRSCANSHRRGIKYKMDAPRDKVKSQRSLKLRLLKDRGEACERCGYNIIEVLEVHHKNKNRNNNRLENLELICPNCHSEEHYLENSWLSSKVSK